MSKRFSRDVFTRLNSTYELFNEGFTSKKLLCTSIINNVGQVSLYEQH